VSATAGAVLEGLRDVRGVLGSFLLSRHGDPLARDMPAVFTDETLVEVAPRIVRLTEAFAADGDEVISCRLRLSEFQLFIQPAGSGMLCALATSDVHVPALRMGLNLAARRLLDLLAAPASPARQSRGDSS
jgi:predicted regulator of Ras-like GTPase activity (Roadblock/LC7/MglB family)